MPTYATAIWKGTSFTFLGDLGPSPVLAQRGRGRRIAPTPLVSAVAANRGPSARAEVELTWNVWAEVYSTSGPVAVYYFAFAEGHDHGTMLALLGGWDEQAPTPQATACFDVAVRTDRLAFRPQPIERHPMNPDADFIGRPSTVDNRELANRFYDMARVAFSQDVRVHTFLRIGCAAW